MTNDDVPSRARATRAARRSRSLLWRMLPSMLLATVGIPLLADLAPADGDRVLWPTGIIVVVALMTWGVTALGRRGLFPPRHALEPQQWRNALRAARTHASIPSDEDLRWAVAGVAYDRLMNLTVMGSLLAGVMRGAMERPDFSWLPAAGALIGTVIGSLFWARAAWAYLNLLGARSAESG